VLPPAFFNWQCEIGVDQTQIDSRPPGFLDCRFVVCVHHHRQAILGRFRCKV